MLQPDLADRFRSNESNGSRIQGDSKEWGSETPFRYSGADSIEDFSIICTHAFRVSVQKIFKLASR